LGKMYGEGMRDKVRNVWSKGGGAPGGRAIRNAAEFIRWCKGGTKSQTTRASGSCSSGTCNNEKR